jgi:hypothetical protein
MTMEEIEELERTKEEQLEEHQTEDIAWKQNGPAMDNQLCGNWDNLVVNRCRVNYWKADTSIFAISKIKDDFVPFRSHDKMYVMWSTPNNSFWFTSKKES